MKKLVVLVSDTGSGTNIQAILDAVSEKKLQANIEAVISDTSDAQAIKRAEKHSVPIIICHQKEDLLPILRKIKPDFIVLSGWKQFITDEVIDKFPNKILNLHPGLIPDNQDNTVNNPDGTRGLWNKGKLTTTAIQSFLNSHATYGGSSIHFLTHEFDFGPVLNRCFEKVTPNDTIESFYSRLKKKENIMYVETLCDLCNTE